MPKLITLSLCLALLPLHMVVANTITTTLYSTQNPQHSLGTVTFKDTQKGLLILPQLSGLARGPHGFHVHELPSCTQQGKDAGGHFDPTQSHQHLGPYNEQGHLGDLPVLQVNRFGNARSQSLAPRLSTADLAGHSLMIHADGDNYNDTPKPLGGGGARVACGVFN